MPRIATPSSLARVAIPAIALAVVTSCATGTPAESPAPVAGAASSAPGATPGPSVRCEGGGWRSIRGGGTRHVAAPTIPVITGVRIAAHPECVFTLALGLGGPASVRIGELPGHWYIDVKG